MKLLKQLKMFLFKGKIQKKIIEVPTEEKPNYNYQVEIFKVNHKEFYGTFIYGGRRLTTVPAKAKWGAAVMVDSNKRFYFNQPRSFCGRVYPDEIRALASFGGSWNKVYRHYYIFFEEQPTKKEVIKLFADALVETRSISESLKW